MLYTTIPRTAFDKTTYPNLEDRMNGAPIPIPIGDLHDVIPTGINTVTKLFKVGGVEIAAFDAIRNGEVTLVAGSDYTTDLANAEFQLVSTPYLAAGTMYWFAIEADFPIDGVNYLTVKRGSTAGYGGGMAYSIDAAGVWTPAPTVDLLFRVRGRTSLAGSDSKIVDTSGLGRGAGFYLRKGAANTRIGHSFTTGASPCYVTSISFWTVRHGTIPASKLRVTIFSAIAPAEVRVGAQSSEIDVETSKKYCYYTMPFPLQSETSDLRCDIRGVLLAGVPAFDGADMLEYLATAAEGLGLPAATLDAAAMANLRTKRPWEVAHNLDKFQKFGTALGKLEQSLLFRFTPLQNQTHGPVVYEAGEPANTAELRDGDFISFSMTRRYSDVRSLVRVKYDESPSDQNVFKLEEADSQVAEFVYGVDEALEVETYHRTQAGAAWLAGALSPMYEEPPLEVKCEVRGWGLDLLPGRDKVKIWKSRAAYAGGALNGVLFRIERILKRPGTRTTEITAVLDTQTY